MQPRLSLVTLGVRDLAASRAFYRRLGFVESSAGNEHVAFFQCGAMALGLFGRDSLAEDANAGKPGEGFKVLDLTNKEVPGVTLKPGVEYMLSLTVKADKSETAQVYFKTK